MAYRSQRSLGFACAFAISLSGCDDGTDDADNNDAGSAADASGAQEDVELSFAAMVGSEPFACGKTYADLGADKRSVSFADARFYIYDIQLIDSAGKHVPVAVPDDNKFQSQGVVLLDFEDQSGECSNGSKETNALVHGKIAEGSYSGIAFGIGMPPEISHGNPALQKPPLSVQALTWPWVQGHKFMRIDVEVASIASDPQHGLEAHLGATGCSGTQGNYSCKNENTGGVELSDFDPSKDRVVFDLGKLLAGMKLATGSDPENPPGCISDVDDAECVPFFAALGLDLATGKESEKPQNVFSVEAR